MTARVQESPFRETAWDQRLDKMLDDLKTTVNPDEGRPSSRRDDSFLSTFRSSSRSESRNSNRSGVEDLGLMKHHHKEYTSPDKTTKIVSDQYEYEAGDPSKNYQKKVMKSTYSNYKVSGDITKDLDSLKQGPSQSIMDAARVTSDQQSDNTRGQTNSYNYSSKSNDYSSSRIPNGKPRYEDEDMEIKQEPSGEVRKIVWRNRFEKTYEAQDGTPHISIEEESRRKREKHLHDLSSSISANQHYVPAPPQISPGGQSWADPIPMPTPPHISPKGEPGVAYVYTYGQSGSSQVQHLPPLNYVNVPPGTTVAHNDSVPSLTPSTGNQPVIYHYSYHYTLQPGHSLPDGVPQPPGTTYPVQPALQVATPADKGPYKSGLTSLNSHEYKKTTTSHTTSSADRSNTTNVTRHYSPERITEPRFPTTTRDGLSYDDRYPRDTEPGSNRNISISINKTSRHVTHTKDYPSGGPSTSTPFPTLGRSRSSSPDRYPRGPGTTPYGTVTHVTRTSYTDSLDRLRKQPHEGLPFPDTSPIKPKDDSKIPRRVDDLMTTLSDSEDGFHRRPLDAKGINGPRAHSPEKEPFITGTKLSSENNELSLSEKRTDLKKEETKNVAGPPVYYPPGHHQLFDESMHTMTLKENKRRGMAKWRMEKASGYKESGSSSQSKGGMAMVPVCLPLCCGAACVIM